MKFQPRNILKPDERLLLPFIPRKVGLLMVFSIVMAFVWESARLLLELFVELRPLSSRFEPWMAAVTDRRVLVRRRLFSKRYSEISLSSIQRVDHDWEAGRLILIGSEHALEIRCDEREAATILEALKGAYQPPKTFWQRLWGL